jgi:hypothetical protein
MSVDRFLVGGVMFQVDDIFRLEGRGGPILVGRIEGGGQLRVGDQLGFRTSDGDAAVLTIIGFDLTPAAAKGELSLVVTGEHSDEVRAGTSLRRLPHQ